MLPLLVTDPEEEFTGAEIRDLTARVTASRRDGPVSRATFSDVVWVASAAAITIGLVIGVAGAVRDALSVRPADPGAAGLDMATVRWLLLVAALALGTGLAARLGPLTVSGAGLRWWLPMPVDRASLLAARLRQALVLWSSAGALCVVVITASTGVPVAGPGLATAAATGAVCGALVVTAVGLIQRRRAVLAAAVVVSDLVVALVPVLGLVLVGAEVSRAELSSAGARGAGAGDGWWDGWWDGGVPVWGVLALLGSAAALGAWRWLRSLEELGAVALTPATAIAGRASTAVASLDLRELGRALDRPGARRPARRTHQLSWVRGPVSALLAGEVVAAVRNPVVAVQVLGLGALALLAQELPAFAGGVGLVLVLVGVGLRAAQLGAQGAHEGEMSPVLDAMLPLGARGVRVVRCVIPAAAAFLALALGSVVQVADDPRWLVLLAAAAGSLGAAAVRGAYRRPPTWSAPLLATPAGAIPTGALSMVTRGPDLAVLTTLPLLLAVLEGSPGWAFVGAQVACAAAAVVVCSTVPRGRA